MKCYCCINYLALNIITMWFKKKSVKKVEKKEKKKIEKVEKVENVEIKEEEMKGSAWIAQKIKDLMR